MQRSSVKLVDRTLHGMVVRPMEHDITGEIIAKAALGEGGLDPSVRRAVSRLHDPFLSLRLGGGGWLSWN